MKVSVAIQAGGESRRMGTDKALIPFLGVPLVQRVRERLRAVGEEVLVTTNAPESLGFLGLPCHRDVVAHRGALGGLCTALACARHPLVAVVACDLPFASPALFQLCLERAVETEADVVIPRTVRGLEPFHAVYRRDGCLPPIRAALEAGLWRADAWFPQVRVAFLEPPDYAHLDPHGRIFLNVNTPEELAIAEGLAERHGG